MIDESVLNSAQNAQEMDFDLFHQVEHRQQILLENLQSIYILKRIINNSTPECLSKSKSFYISLQPNIHILQLTIDEKLVNLMLFKV